MKLVTEFASFTLNKAIQTKNALTGEGKTPEEISESLGKTFKFEGDKLKHFMNSLDVGHQNAQNLKRVVVMTLAEGESTPAKAVKIEEHVYVPEFLIMTKHSDAQASKGAQKGKGKGRDGGKKGSPWGLSPEETAAKTNKGAAAKAATPAK